MAKGMVLIPSRKDWEILDDKTLDRVCDSCGRELDLPHVRDINTTQLFYFGCCQCGAQYKIELLSENDDDVTCDDESPDCRCAKCLDAMDEAVRGIRALRWNQPML